MKKLITTSAMALFLLSGPIVANAGTCRLVHFEVANMSSGPIKLLKISYSNLSTGRRKTENFRNGVCAPNRLCRIRTGQNLPNARDSRLDNFQFHYKTLNEFGNWSNRRTSRVFRANDQICIANRTYGGQFWQIAD